jgi:hypothetical protein
MKELENMEYIYDKVMFITKFEKLHIHFKTRVGGGTIVWIFLWCMILL